MGITHHDIVNLQCVFWESSWFLGGDWTGAASAIDEAGVTAEAELKSRIGDAAKVAHGGGSAVVCKHQGFTCTLRRIAGHSHLPLDSGGS